MSDAIAVPPEEVVAEEPQVPTRRLLVFEVGGHGFACDMDAFREIVPTQEMTRLPGAPETVCGLINLRGTIVTVIDGGVSLGKPAFKRAEGLILLVDFVDRWVGVGVDDVRDIQDVPIDQFASAGETEIPLAGAVTGVVEIDGRRVLVLDIKTVIQQVLGQGR
jgi:purine-binding chemotaxis protein CheW